MTGYADASLVIAATQAEDALHRRALAHLEAHGRLTVPFSVSLELLLGAKRRGTTCVSVIGVMDDKFVVERKEVLLTAARAIDERRVPTVFDAVHLAEALHAGAPLHAADERLLRSRFPTVPF
jgi:predicted nucleic acid-binding protein